MAVVNMVKYTDPSFKKCFRAPKTGSENKEEECFWGDYLWEDPYIVVGGKKRKAILQVFDNFKKPSTGFHLGKFIVETLCLEGKTALGIGCGAYAPTEFMLACSYDLSVDATEINEDAARLARFNVRENNLQNSITICISDIDAKLPQERSYFLLYSNIAQMPKPPWEEDSLHDYGGEDGWLLLQRVLNISRTRVVDGGYVALVVFDFLGIHSRNADGIPSLVERAEKLSLSIFAQRELLRKVREGGVTKKALPHILNVYPKASFYNSEGRVLEDPLSEEELYAKIWMVLLKKESGGSHE